MNGSSALQGMRKSENRMSCTLCGIQSIQSEQGPDQRDPGGGGTLFPTNADDGHQGDLAETEESKGI